MQIIINDITWKLEETDNSELLSIDGDVRLGITDYQSQRIWIKAGMQKEIREQTVMREVLHALRFSYGYPCNMSEESFCAFIGANIRLIGKIWRMTPKESAL